MIDFNNIQNVYFLGIGGIGMSALARFSKHMGKNVAGYDLTETSLTRQLQAEGIDVHYNDEVALIPSSFKKENTLVVRTPAVPASHSEYCWLIENDFNIIKRSQLLGFLTRDKNCVAVAGTHGKTSVSTMITFLLHECSLDVGAFLGGISRNFNSNLVLPKNPESIVVAEADEYDRSFHQLFPTTAVITSLDPDHLDIYGTYDEVKKAFGKFVQQVDDHGTVLVRKGVDVSKYIKPTQKLYTYSGYEMADYCAENLVVENGGYSFNLKTPKGIIENVRIEYPGRVNVENMVAAMAVALLNGADLNAVKAACLKYKGVQRRFDIRFKSDEVVYMDDYAHHPEELKACITSVRELYVNKKIVGLFQPHLYTRTRDFAEGFAASLDLLDEAILLDIYPARELPLPGITSEVIFEKMKIEHKHKATLKNAVVLIEEMKFDVLLTLGAGSIDTLVQPIIKMLEEK